MHYLYLIMCVIVMVFGTISNGYSATATISYIEPSAMVSGDPITDLKEIELAWKQDNGAETLLKVPATKATGGGSVSKVITFADPPACGKTTVSVTAVAVNVAGLRSEKAGPATTVRDVSKLPECVKPKFPSGLTITLTP